jgi:hypothetical protein
MSGGKKTRRLVSKPEAFRDTNEAAGASSRTTIGADSMKTLGRDLIEVVMRRHCSGQA